MQYVTQSTFRWNIFSYTFLRYFDIIFIFSQELFLAFFCSCLIGFWPEIFKIFSIVGQFFSWDQCTLYCHCQMKSLSVDNRFSLSTFTDLLLTFLWNCLMLKTVHWTRKLHKNCSCTWRMCKNLDYTWQIRSNIHCT